LAYPSRPGLVHPIGLPSVDHDDVDHGVVGEEWL
jgi:hypothetical protein